MPASLTATKNNFFPLNFQDEIGYSVIVSYSVYAQLAADYESEQTELREKLTAELLREFIRRTEAFEKPEKYSRTCGNTIVIHYTFDCDKAFIAAWLGKSA